MHSGMASQHDQLPGRTPPAQAHRAVDGQTDAHERHDHGDLGQTLGVLVVDHRVDRRRVDHRTEQQPRGHERHRPGHGVVGEQPGEHRTGQQGDPRDEIQGVAVGGHAAAVSDPFGASAMM